MEKESVEITRSDVELLFHLFWLPHSHGPKGEMLVNEFKYLRDHAHLMLKFDDEEEDEQYQQQSAENEFFESWLERASSFNNVCKRFLKMCDKFTFIDNRELFFDINSYLSNTQVIFTT